MSKSARIYVRDNRGRFVSKRWREFDGMLHSNQPKTGDLRIRNAMVFGNDNPVLEQLGPNGWHELHEVKYNKHVDMKTSFDYLRRYGDFLNGG